MTPIDVSDSAPSPSPRLSTASLSGASVASGGAIGSVSPLGLVPLVVACDMIESVALLSTLDDTDDGPDSDVEYVDVVVDAADGDVVRVGVVGVVVSVVAGEPTEATLLVEQSGNGGSHALDMPLVPLSQRPNPTAGATSDRVRVWRAGLAGSEQVADEHCDQFDHCTTQSAQFELHGTVVSLIGPGEQPAERSATAVVTVVLITSKQPAAWPHVVVLVLLHSNVAQQLGRSPPHSPLLEYGEGHRMPLLPHMHIRCALIKVK